jgi:predicted DNA binding CopG/RHH family protein
MTKKKNKLDAYEQEIEDNLHKFKQPKNHKQIEKNLITAAKNYSKERKSVTIRLLNSDIEAMKEKAAQMGVPYQTYINILIHRDAISSHQ